MFSAVLFRTILITSRSLSFTLLFHDICSINSQFICSLRFVRSFDSLGADLIVLAVFFWGLFLREGADEYMILVDLLTQTF